MLKNLSSAAVVIGALRFNHKTKGFQRNDCGYFRYLIQASRSVDMNVESKVNFLISYPKTHVKIDG